MDSAAFFLLWVLLFFVSARRTRFGNLSNVTLHLSWCVVPPPADSRPPLSVAEVGCVVVVVIVIGVVVVTLLSFAHSTSCCCCPNSAARGGGDGVVDGCGEEEGVDGESVVSSPAALGTSGDDDWPAEELIATGAAQGNHSQSHVAVAVHDSTGGPHGVVAATLMQKRSTFQSLAIEEGVASTVSGRYPSSGCQVGLKLALAVRGQRAGATSSSAGTGQRGA